MIMRQIYLLVFYTVLKLKLFTIVKSEDIIHNVTINGYLIQYNVSSFTIRTHPLKKDNPVTLIDLATGQFVYITDENCYVGRTRERIRRKQNPSSVQFNSNIERVIKKLFGQYRIFYADGPLSEIQVHKLLPRKLQKDCEYHTVWRLEESKPKRTTFEQFVETYERNRTRDFTRLKTEGENGRKRLKRNVRHGSGRRKNRSPIYTHANTPAAKYRKHKRYPSFQSDDSSFGKVVIADGVTYVSPSFNPNHQESTGFRHYKDFNNELDVIDRDSKPMDQLYESAPSIDQKEVQFPKTIMKDGQLFYRHDADDNQEENLDHIVVTDEPVKPQMVPQENMSFNLHQNTEKDSMPRGFNELLNHVREAGARNPLLSAAIAGASVRGKGKESSSHVIGTAINGGYFAASAQGYDGRGGKIHSHVQGTAERVSGAAAAIAPERVGESFIQVDHSERGLSIGQSSTQNGEAFVLADVNRESEQQLQSGDSTSSFTDNYNTRRRGHTFGEAKSHISTNETANTMGLRNPQGDEFSKEQKRSGQSQQSVGMNMLEGIMEKVLQPGTAQPAISVDNVYFTERYPSQGYIYNEHNTEGIHAPTITVAPQLPSGLQSVEETAANKKDSKGVVGLATFPFGQVGSPPGPGELLTTQVAQTDDLPPSLLDGQQDELYDYLYTEDQFLQFQRKKGESDNLNQLDGNGIIANHNLQDDKLNKMPKFHLSNMPHVDNFYNSAFNEPEYSNNIFDQQYNQTEQPNLKGKLPLTTHQRNQTYFTDSHQPGIEHQVTTSDSVQQPSYPVLYTGVQDSHILGNGFQQRLPTTTQPPPPSQFPVNSFYLHNVKTDQSSYNLNNIEQQTNSPSVATSTYNQQGDYFFQQTFSQKVNESLVNGRINPPIPDLPMTEFRPVDIPHVEEGYRRSAIQPGKPGSTQIYESSSPDQPIVNVVTVDKNGRNLIYQQEGEPINAGEAIPGLPGYSVPSGFRGRVIYGNSVPVKFNSKKTVQGYNTRVKVQRQQNSQSGPLLAFVSGPHANLQFNSDQNPGVHIALSSNQNPQDSPFDVVDSQSSKSAVSTPISRQMSQSYRNTPVSRHATLGRKSTSRTASRSSQIARNADRGPRNNGGTRRSSNIQSSNDDCGYYTKDCQTMNGPYRKMTLCVPKFIVVACCC